MKSVLVNFKIYDEEKIIDDKFKFHFWSDNCTNNKLSSSQIKSCIRAFDKISHMVKFLILDDFLHIDEGYPLIFEIVCIAEEDGKVIESISSRIDFNFNYAGKSLGTIGMMMEAFFPSKTLQKLITKYSTAENTIAENTIAESVSADLSGEDTKQLFIHISNQTHHKLKRYAIYKNLTMKSVVTELIEKYCTVEKNNT